MVPVAVVAAAFQRVAEAALDCAQPNDDIGPRPDGAGGLARVLVGKGVDQHIGVVRLDRLGDLVDKMEHRACMAAFAFVQGLAAVAGAEIGPVVLADREDTAVRVVPDPLAHFIDRDAHDIGIGQAQL